MSQARTTPPIINLMGPTASGKTALALAVAEQLEGEIISVDSALIYRDMDIGTAKPTAQELERVKHWLVDIVDPAQPYSAADFCRDALAAVEDIRRRGKVPLLVGGTMMYYNALMAGMSQVPESDPRVRTEVHEEAAIKGWQALHNELANVDPVIAARVHPNDPQRIGRALEVYRMTGKPLSEWQQQKTPGLADITGAHIHQFAIAPDDRKVLHQRIHQRYLEMLSGGLINEVENLRQRKDLHLNLPSMRCVGYRQVWQHLDGDYDYPTMVDKGVAATRQLAKRQFTWLRNWTDVQWLDTFAVDNEAKIVESVTI
ncbi:tRNA (adenosine(37)-N6)-dimethylallyltransferase MiaA [Alteromonas oceanisediminis]|uniref:tRNA (adenosine(37)-N6)-dimethylallyltransferase MiaA n=1 Tax=Alteromonas oceanisediminis TaxID=2836180 RepID=UPI001BDA7E04|nr:tRNA (adenosine(37)-N6)-dimethylallyltransferase MiaA [Alteromonas oceanisediminis]MBT0586934.1 tRNA (adenosine(37)-N6)-dimethylallyltransferase MiaA [Alteromonas oceanisediminis]